MLGADIPHITTHLVLSAEILSPNSRFLEPISRSGEDAPRRCSPKRMWEVIAMGTPAGLVEGADTAHRRVSRHRRRPSDNDACLGELVRHLTSTAPRHNGTALLSKPFSYLRQVAITWL
jgi:hypothetical protein